MALRLVFDRLQQGFQLVGVVSDLRFDGHGGLVLGDEFLEDPARAGGILDVWCAVTASGLAVLT